MTVAELIEELKKMPADKTVIIFDGPTYCTPSLVYLADDWGGEGIRGKVVID